MRTHICICEYVYNFVHFPEHVVDHTWRNSDTSISAALNKLRVPAWKTKYLSFHFMEPVSITVSTQRLEEILLFISFPSVLEIASLKHIVIAKFKN